ncbi:MAG TPA: L-seryl-tRNA(Sec) selenium transferase [Thermodesulfobium narugense]|uniref:L-seryl-tRNA(Sec) selenium transferase n=1 Tax=Thermodesulfobium acidiphilum TaxID=1794699 RepID=A0A2R4W0V4_THEAF|nr:L-seryl-tRNA(Sec) selenium transferase [Thermodesulfobium acidiphilum]AWB10439.1 L-seryl-tRNA(Sec) selenium transferase [Thermodesulfobium acidiphilum]PMP86762.1 MAG: L-seryl-tRNA(Sec) selenium transferase [Thermodesulfobium narugense]HEM55216.1 L-seryl-tRNA(Sec) selenium transferase [Thermodesulfobium narugense]
MDFHQIPSISYILKEIKRNDINVPHDLCVLISQREVEIAREAIRSGKNITKDKIIENIKIKLNFLNKSVLKRVINATGIIIHTNLGRSPLNDSVAKEVAEIATNYSNLEYDLFNNKRGRRDLLIRDILIALTGSEDATVVNNNAAAVYITLNTLLNKKEVLISRSELIEIGGSFRIPDVITSSGAILKEVGTTNKTHLRDYENNISELTGAIMKVHQSNFYQEGFVQSVKMEELSNLARKKNILFFEDLGSGCLIDLRKYGLNYEPTVQESIQKGTDIVSFSGDKLLGAGQCGIILGKSKLIERIRKNPLMRVLRVDKMTLCALEGTLRLYLDKRYEEIPVYRMLAKTIDEMIQDAKYIISNVKNKNLTLEIFESEGRLGGGSTPRSFFKTIGIGIKHKILSTKDIETFLTRRSIPIIGRVLDDFYFLDMKTVYSKELDFILQALSEMS